MHALTRTLGPFKNLAIALTILALSVPWFYREEVLGPPLASLVTFTAFVTHVMLSSLGIDAALNAATISETGGFAYEIYYRCTGFLPVLCLLVAVLAHPSRLRRKLTALAIAIPFILALNFVRLVHLFWIGQNQPAAFDLAHNVVWQTVIIVSTAGMWIAYLISEYRTAHNGENDNEHKPDGPLTVGA